VKKHRPYWKGYLRLSLVTIGIGVYNAVEAKSGVKLRIVHKPTGKPISQIRTVDGRKVESSDLVKGYEVDENKFIAITEDELAALKLESKRTIDLTAFVDRIDPRYVERAYYIAPTDALAAEGFLVIRDALLKSGKIGMSQMVIGGREWLVAISPHGSGMVMSLLRYHEEIRDPLPYFEDIPSKKPDAQLVDMACKLIKQKSGPWQPEQFKDNYAVAMQEMIEEKIKTGKVLTPPESTAPTNVIDLAGALRKSIEQVPAPKKRKATA
jgi:DNA end-binding protein Ku